MLYEVFFSLYVGPYYNYCNAISTYYLKKTFIKYNNIDFTRKQHKFLCCIFVIFDWNLIQSPKLTFRVYPGVQRN